EGSEDILFLRGSCSIPDASGRARQSPKKRGRSGPVFLAFRRAIARAALRTTYGDRGGRQAAPVLHGPCDAQTAPSEVFTCATMAAKAGLSLTANSASTLRSSPIAALFRPAIKRL